MPPTGRRSIKKSHNFIIVLLSKFTANFDFGIILVAAKTGHTLFLSQKKKQQT